MHRLTVCLGLALGSCASTPAASHPAPTGVVLILIDDLGWADLACCGSDYYETPNLDRLASEGMRFTHAYAAQAVCSPTRAAVLTGRAPARHGITDWIRARFQGGAMPADGQNPSGWVRNDKRALEVPENHLWMESSEITIAEALAPDGFVSCHIGKWHLGTDAWYPERQGFDVNIGGCDFGHPPSYFDPYYKESQGQLPLDPRREGEYLTDREADEAAGFLRAHADENFFLYYAPYAVHTPIQAREDLTKRFQQKPKTHQKNAKYAAMVYSMDQAVGTILDTLEELGRAEDTLIIFTSDNGGLMGPTSNAPLRDGKGSPYEGGIRVPLLVRWPGVVPAGAVSDSPVTSVDLLPTIVDAVGAARPDATLDGESLVAHCISGGEIALERDALFWHYPHYRYTQWLPYSIVREGDLKLLRWWEGEAELYDLALDPGETRDLAEASPAVVERLSLRLDEHLQEVGARLPRPRSE